MAIKFVSNYSKRLGLPGYSSHQFSVSVETELTDLERVPGEVARLYHLLQQSVDREIQQTGFVPGEDYGEMPRAATRSNGNGHGSNGSNGHGHTPVTRGDTATDTEPTWKCSERQRELIAELATELNLDDAAVDALSERLFQRPARQLNKLSASALISDLLADASVRRQRDGRNSGPSAVAARRNGTAD